MGSTVGIGDMTNEVSVSLTYSGFKPVTAALLMFKEFVSESMSNNQSGPVPGKEKEKEKAAEDELFYIAPIKHDPGSYNLSFSCSKFNGLALIDLGAALNMMPVGYCRKMGVKKIVPTD
ncbi:hypothetical protein OSB04_023842 [Centaurea solstitialis]|uniref:Uncharacterized protein n=1 Tax=Centaurea solstitialis TaxID=347529 RepID=A0AA38SXD1_9ASTR|nr:hypothetical protein OSB04_023842 [Centaurea solstitialis]